jgi:hypothetical protein
MQMLSQCEINVNTHVGSNKMQIVSCLTPPAVFFQVLRRANF